MPKKQISIEALAKWLNNHQDIGEVMSKLYAEGFELDSDKSGVHPIYAIRPNPDGIQGRENWDVICGFAYSNMDGTMDIFGSIYYFRKSPNPREMPRFHVRRFGGKR